MSDILRYLLTVSRGAVLGEVKTRPLSMGQTLRKLAFGVAARLH